MVIPFIPPLILTNTSPSTRRRWKGDINAYQLFKIFEWIDIFAITLWRVVHLVVWVGGRSPTVAAQAGLCCSWPPCAAVLSWSVSSMPLSKKCGFSSVPHRDPYCESLLQQWFSLPAGQSLEVSLSLSRQSVSRSSLFPASLSWSPAP